MPQLWETPIAEWDNVDGKTTTFPYRFQILAADDMRVHIDQVDVPNTLYTITGVGNMTGGTVIFNTAPAANSSVMIMRETPFIRTTDYQDNGDLIADELDDDLNRLWLAMQETKASNESVISRPAAGGDWDAQNRLIRNVKDGVSDHDAATVGQVMTLNGGAQNSANAAAKSARDAADSAAKAYQSEMHALNSTYDCKTQVTNAQTYSNNSLAYSTIASQESSKASTQAINSATSATTASTNAYAASQSVVAANMQADRAKQEADRAQSANPNNQLKKANNLSDVANMPAAWDNVWTGQAGPLTLKAEGQSSYDAVTVMQLQRVTGGAATMSGVMNNYIGAVEWFNGPRTMIPPGYIAADGQLVSRTDSQTADLWTAVGGGMFGTVTDAFWLNSGLGDNSKWGLGRSRVGEYRGHYSLGDGSTTFRVPDLNGVFDSESIKALFLRGDGGGNTSAGGVGTVLRSAAPNITGGVELGYPNTGYLGNVGSSGAFEPSTKNTATINPQGTPGSSDRGFNFEASRSSPIYGMPNAGSTDPAVSDSSEMRPNAVVGVWLIRASGSFRSANTEFGSFNSFTTATYPVAGTEMKGGNVKSSLMLDGMDNEHEVCAAGLQVIQNRGDKYSQARIGVYHKGSTPQNGADPNKLTYLRFTSDGDLYVPNWTKAARFEATSYPKGWADWNAKDSGAFHITDIDVSNNGGAAPIMISSMATRSGGSAGNGWPQHFGMGQFVPGNDVASWGYGFLQIAGDNGNNARFIFGMTGDFSVISQANNGPLTTTVFATQSWVQRNYAPISDENKKFYIQPFDGKQSLANIEAMEFKTFHMLDHKPDVERRGVIAQQIEKIDPEYVREIDGVKHLDTAPLLLDALAAIKVLAERVKVLESATQKG